MSKISFVIPCILKDIELLKLCIYSLISLFENNDIDNIYIIVPTNEIYIFQKILTINNKLITIVDEKNIINLHIHNGWIKQQILKLYISNIIKTEYYIVLDADCFLAKSINIKDIIINNKAIVSLIHKHKNNWLIKSCKYFNLDYNKLPNNILNVTPQILKTTIVKELISQHNIILLINNGCNEYWLYFCYLLTKYSFDEIYYLKNNKCNCQECNTHNFALEPPYPLYNKGIWVKQNFKNNSIEEIINDMFNDNSVLFTLIQSNMNLSKSYVSIIYNNINNFKNNT